MGREFRRRWDLATLACLLAAALAVGVGVWLLVHADDPWVLPPEPEDWTVYETADNSTAFLDAVDRFAMDTASQLLSRSSTAENQIFSPMGLYSALSVLAESADGTTQETLWGMLGLDEIADPAGEFDRMYQRLVGRGTVWMENSLWIGRRMQPDRDVLLSLAQQLHIEVYPCDLDHEDTAARMGEWLAERTDERWQTVQLPGSASESHAHLLTTLRAEDSWRIPFDSRVTGMRSFHLSDRQTVETEFISRTIDAHPIISGEDYLASYLSLENGGRMHLILPNRGITPQSLLRNSWLLEEVLDGYALGRSRLGDVILTMPKFSISSTGTLSDYAGGLGLSALTGENDYSTLADGLKTATLDLFTGLTVNERGVGLFPAERIGEGDQGEVVKTNELVYLILDRPFIFMITSPDGRILQIGIVNNPTL